MVEQWAHLLTQDHPINTGRTLYGEKQEYQQNEEIAECILNERRYKSQEKKTTTHIEMDMSTCLIKGSK